MKTQTNDNALFYDFKCSETQPYVENLNFF